MPYLPLLSTPSPSEVANPLLTMTVTRGAKTFIAQALEAASYRSSKPQTKKWQLDSDGDKPQKRIHQGSPIRSMQPMVELPPVDPWKREAITATAAAAADTDEPLAMEDETAIERAKPFYLGTFRISLDSFTSRWFIGYN